MITLDDFPDYLQQRRHKKDITRTISRLSSSSIESNSSHIDISPHHLPIRKKKQKRPMSCYVSQLLTSLIPPLPTIPPSTQEKSKSDLTSKFKAVRSNKRNFSVNTQARKQYYAKNCHVVSHFHKVNKLISPFLPPMNNFISTDFNLRIEEYEEVINKMGNKRPPRIPTNQQAKYHPFIRNNSSKKSLCI